MGRSGLGATAILSLGAFAVGTDAFIVSGFLPSIADSLDVSVPAAGWSVTVFAATYALLAPVLSTVLAGLPRRRLLVGALLVLGLANLASALATNLAVLLAARALAALGAAAYTPTATAVGGALVRPELRARAFSMVTGGLTVATALGVPLGNLISHWLGWRAALALVAALSLASALGVRRAMPALPGLARVPLRARLRVLRRPGVAAVLPLTVVGMMACYTPYAYTVPTLQGLGVADGQMGWMLLCYGLGAIIGNLAAGYATDRWGAMPVSVAAYGVMALAFGFMAWLAAAGRAPAAVAGALALVWGASSWGQTPPQQFRLTAAAPQEAPLVVALNASALYLGIAAGTGVGGMAIVHGAAVACGLAAVLALAALVWLAVAVRAGWRR